MSKRGWWWWIPGGACHDNPDHGMKSHMVTPRLFSYLRKELTERAGGELPKSFAPSPDDKVRRARQLNMDAGGMWAVGQPIEKFQIGRLELSIPSSDLDAMIARVEKLQVRYFITTGAPAKTQRYAIPGVDVPYFKLHERFKCLVMTPHQHKRLLANMKARLLEADRRAKTFWASRMSPAEVLRQAAAKATGTPIGRIGDLGGHNVDRHLPKIVGQA